MLMSLFWHLENFFLYLNKNVTKYLWDLFLSVLCFFFFIIWRKKNMECLWDSFTFFSLTKHNEIHDIAFFLIWKKDEKLMKFLSIYIFILDFSSFIKRRKKQTTKWIRKYYFHIFSCFYLAGEWAGPDGGKPWTRR